MDSNIKPPSPKTPMIAKIGKVEYRFVVITTASLDAQNWIRNTAPQYGTLNEMPSNNHLVRYGLFVEEVYDLQEVVDYINAMAQGFQS